MKRLMEKVNERAKACGMECRFQHTGMSVHKKNEGQKHFASSHEEERKEHDVLEEWKVTTGLPPLLKQENAEFVEHLREVESQRAGGGQKWENPELLKVDSEEKIKRDRSGREGKSRNMKMPVGLHNFFLCKVHD